MITVHRKPFRIILIKPSKYARNGYVERFYRGLMPNSTLLHIKSLTPSNLAGQPVILETIDEYTEINLNYLKRLRPETCSLLALVGVQSHQMHRAIDLAALAKVNGVANCVIGGPHVMTCDTKEIQNRGISFALAESELIWIAILNDALKSELKPIYGEKQRWQEKLESKQAVLHTDVHMRRYIIPMVGIYPARGCPYNCNFCSVVKIAGKIVRSQPVETTIESMLIAQKMGARLVMFTSDNFNKYPEARSLLQAIVERKVNMPFFVQCDTQLSRDEEFIALLARAGCAQVFVGIESFSRNILKTVGKYQNHPKRYIDLVQLCHKHGISTHFSNIIGFPQQDEGAILEHIEMLRSIRPFIASFYILTPIPGTDQYDDYLAKGLIHEMNLDRFDATCAVWQHPFLDRQHLEQLLFQAYRKFYSAKEVLTKLLGQNWNAPWYVRSLGFAYAGFARYAVWRKTHPMTGGLFAVRCDCTNDYLSIRRHVYGIDQLTLPKSLAISSH